MIISGGEKGTSQLLNIINILSIHRIQGSGKTNKD